MSWTTMPPELRELAERVCTPRELDVLRLRAEGHGRYRIAAILGINGSRVEQLRSSAFNRLRKEGYPL